MRSIATMTLLALMAGAASAQTASPNSPPGSSRTTTDLPRNSAVGTGEPAAAGDRNQAIATTPAHASEPAHGANSFSEGEARKRIEANGFTTVGALAKDNEGIWRAPATRGGKPVHAWLDYKGNVGQD